MASGMIHATLAGSMSGHDSYPLRDILTELTFETNDSGLDPFDAYVRFAEEMQRHELQAVDYCSSSITSGGHARDTSLEMGQVIARNTDTALRLGEALFAVGQLDPRTAVEPVALGKVAWPQSGYMTFWLATMAGLRSRGAGINQVVTGFRNDLLNRIDRSKNLDMAVFDARVAATERAPHYFAFAQLFADTVKAYEPRPIRRLIRLVDPELSLGAQTENVFARLMQSGVFRAAVARTGLAPDESSLTPQLVDDTQRLIRFGATIFDTEKRHQIVLVPQEG